jgi:hypothetical protein
VYTWTWLNYCWHVELYQKHLKVSRLTADKKEPIEDVSKMSPLYASLELKSPTNTYSLFRGEERGLTPSADKREKAKSERTGRKANRPTGPWRMSSCYRLLSGWVDGPYERHV